MNKILSSPYPVAILPFRLTFNFSSKIFWILVLATIFSLLVVSIFQINTYTREFFLIQEYEKKISQLSQENKILEIDFSSANSLKNLSNYTQNQIFERVDGVDYIRILESTVLAQ